MIIIGVDPGSRVTGYGVIEVEGNHLRCVRYGAIEVYRTGAKSLAERLKRIHEELCALLQCHCPSVLAVEDLFYAVNAKTALKLGHVRGIILLAAAQGGISLAEYSPLEVKKAVVGYGRAQKSQIQQMVRALLNLQQEPQPHDAADALAIAICHAFNGSLNRRRRRRWSGLP